MTIILETPRLILRHLTINDLEDLHKLNSDPQVRKYFPGGVLSYEQTKEQLHSLIEGFPNHPELGLWATIHKETGRFIGRCGLLLWDIEGLEEVEVAYMLDKAYWGQGLATEAAQAILRYGFETLELRRLVCLIEAENSASIRVAEKLGMTFEKEGRDDLGPFLVYSSERK